MAELADAMDLGSIGQPCRFKSCYPHSKEATRQGGFLLNIKSGLEGRV